MKANQKFRSDEDAVSPVIAVILMVAITVVLSATVYVWVSGFSGNHNQPAHAVTLISDAPLLDGAKSFTVAASSSDLAYRDLTITRNGATLLFAEAGAAPDACRDGTQALCRGETVLSAASLVKAGDRVQITGAAAGDVLRVIDVEANTVLYTVTIG